MGIIIRLYLIFSLPGLLGALQAFSQTTNPPPLGNVYTQLKDLEEKAFNLRETHPDEAITYAEKGLALATSVPDSGYMAQFYARLGNAYENKSLWDEAMENYKQSLQIATAMGDPYGKGRALNQIATTLSHQIKPREALPYFGKALDEFKLAASKDKSSKPLIAIVSVLAEKGEAYSLLGESSRAQQVFLEAIDTLEKLGDSPNVLLYKGKMYSQTGIAFERDHFYRTALFNYRKDLQIQEEVSHTSTIDSAAMAKTLTNIGNSYLYLGMLDSAKYFYDQSLQISQKLDPSPFLANTYQSVGLLLLKRNYLDQAKKYLEESRAFRGEAYQEGIEKDLIALGHLHLKQANISEAESLLQEAIELSVEHDLPQLEMEARNVMAELFIVKGDFKKAFREKSLADDIRSEKIEARIEVSEITFLEEKKRLELSIFQVDKELLNQKITNNRNLRIFIVLGLFLAFLTTIGFSQSTIARNKIELIEKEKEIEYEEMKNLGAAKARNEIAHELHENVGALLTGVGLHVQYLQNELFETDEGKYKQAKKASQMLKKAIVDVRDLSHKLSDNFEEEFGLKYQLESLIEDLRIDDEGQIDFKTDIELIDIHVPDNHQREIFRITQELISNAIKHAKPSEIAVFLFHEENEEGNFLKLMVEDDGNGFAKGNNPGIGFKNIQRRLKKLNGKITIDSVPEQGTTVMIDIPISL